MLYTFTSFVLGVVMCAMNRCTCRHTPWFCKNPHSCLNEDVEVKKREREEGVRERERERRRENQGEGGIEVAGVI